MEPSGYFERLAVAFVRRRVGDAAQRTDARRTWLRPQAVIVDSANVAGWS